jgi:hypothetical protein
MRGHPKAYPQPPSLQDRPMKPSMRRCWRPYRSTAPLTISTQLRMAWRFWKSSAHLIENNGMDDNFCAVGGFAQLTTVVADAVISRILHRWPDHAGDSLSRATVDGTSFQTGMMCGLLPLECLAASPNTGASAPRRAAFAEQLWRDAGL